MSIHWVLDTYRFSPGDLLVHSFCCSLRHAYPWDTSLLLSWSCIRSIMQGISASIKIRYFVLCLRGISVSLYGHYSPTSKLIWYTRKTRGNGGENHKWTFTKCTQSYEKYKNASSKVLYEYIMKIHCINSGNILVSTVSLLLVYKFIYCIYIYIYILYSTNSQIDEALKKNL